MKIHSLRLENFMIFRKFFRVFGDKDIIGIVARYADNKELSNRAGKSIIVEAMKYILTGKSRADVEMDLIYYGADSMMGTLVLDDNGKKITIQRGKKKDGKKILTIDGILDSKKRDVQKQIDDLIGYDKDELDLTCFFKQMDINQFMELGSAKMKSHMMKWIKNLHWNKLEEAVNEDVVKSKNSIELLQIQFDGFSSESTNIRNIKKSIKDNRERYKNVELNKSSLQKIF